MKPLYVEKPYCKKINTHIQNIHQAGETIVLTTDETIAVPPKDGKTLGDQMYIDGVPIEIIKDDMGRTIYKSEESFQKDQSVEMTLDWSHRLKLMEQNIGRVILTIALKELEDLTPIETYTEEKSYVILNIKDLSFKSLEQLEDLCNRIIQSNLPIKSFKEDGINYVEIEGYNKIESYTPALKHTGECAIMTLGPVEKTNDNIKLNFSTGELVRIDNKRQRRLIHNMEILFNTYDLNKIWKEVRRLKSKINDQTKEIEKLEESLGLEALDEFLSHRSTVNGTHYIYEILNNVNFKNLQKIIQRINEKPSYVQIYGIPNGPRAQIIVSRSNNVNVDLKAILDKLGQRFELQGSGNLYKVRVNCDFNILNQIMESFLYEIREKLEK